MRAALPLIGLLTLLGQVCLLRELLVAFYGTELILLLALGLWLLWTAVGAMLGRRATVTSAQVRALLVVFAVALPASLVFLRGIRPLWAVVPGAYLSFPRQMLSMAAALLPAGVLSGLLFQRAARLYLQAPRRTLARAYALESTGGLAGGLLATLLLKWGLQNLSTVLLTSLAAAAAAWALPPRRRDLPRLTAVGLTALVVAGLIASRSLDRHLTRWSHAQLVDTRDTPYGRVTLTEHEGRLAVFVNDALAHETQSVSAETFVHPVLLQHVQPRRVLILGGLVEGLVGETLRHHPGRVVDVELDAGLLDLVVPRLSAAARRDLDNDAVTLHIDDPRRFLAGASRYDVILIGMPEPESGAANRFYTREFFDLCRAHLAAGGLLGLRLRTAENFWTPQQTGRVASIVAAMRDVFADVLVLPGTSSTLIGSSGPLDRDPTPLCRRLVARGIHGRLMSEPYLRYLYTNDRVEPTNASLRAATVPANTDAHPICYVQTQMLWLANFFPALGRMDPERALRWTRRHGPWVLLFWLLLIAAIRVRTRKGEPARVGLVAAAGMLGMVLENLLILQYQTKSGVLYQNVGMLITMFMAGLALGALAIARRARRAGSGMGRLLVLGFGVESGVLAWSFAVGGVGGLFTVSLHLLVVGVLVSAVFAYASLSRAADQSALVAPLYAADLVGGFLGSLGASLLLAPLLGLPVAAVAVAVLALPCVALA